jgi:hypothetical protein
VDPPSGADLLTANTYAGDALSGMLLQRLGLGSGILATSLVRLDTLEATSAFGRLAGQQISSRIAQHGFMVLDVRLTNAFSITGEGEFMLSRDVGRLLAAEYKAHAVLVGTYSPGEGRIFVSARILRLTDGTVLAAYEYFLPLSGDTVKLLGSGAGSGPSSEAVWHKYNARGQAFAAQNRENRAAASVQEKRSPAGPGREAQAAARNSGRPVSGTVQGRESPASRSSPAAAPLPEEIPLMSGGKRIQP